MTQGVLLFAENNSQIDYIKQSIFCAKRIKKYLNLPVCLVTDNLKYLKTLYKNYNNVFDTVIEVPSQKAFNKRTLRDGLYSEKTLDWKNYSRSNCYELTPYDETIVMDTDVIISNDILLECFNTSQDFLIVKESHDINTTRSTEEFKRVSDRSIDMYWATLFYFKKNKNTKILFDLVNHIKENYSFYRLTYKITEKKYRNDFAFSIAIHILNGFKKTNWPLPMPGKLWHILDKDILVNISSDMLTCLLAKNHQYFAASIKGSNVHIMNKFSLNRIIDEQL